MKSFLTLLFTLSFCVSLSAQNKKVLIQRNNELNQTIIELNQKQGELNGKIEILQTQNSELKSQNESLNIKVNELTGEITKLKNENEALKRNAQITAVSGATQKDTLLAVYKDYWKANTVEQRAKYVIDPERVKPLMKSFYKKGMSSSANFNNGLTIKAIEGNIYPIFIIRESVLGGLVDTYIICTPNGYKVDWEATVTYNPFNVNQMKANPNKEYEYRTKLFDCRGSYTNDYWYEYYGDFHVYVKKNTQLANKLLNFIDFNGAEDAIIKIKYDASDSAFEIVDLISKSLSKY